MNRALRVLAAAIVLTADRPPTIRVDAATTNDNTKPAGQLDGTTLSVSLELREAAWQPGGPGTRSIRVFAFTERGRAPSVPGPLIRVAVGTTVNASIANRLDRRAILRLCPIC